MVPLDGFSLACNIFQAISFTREVFLQVKDIVDQGKGDYDGDLISSKVERLAAFCDEIDDKKTAITRTNLPSNAPPTSVKYRLASALPKVFAIAFPGTLPSASDSKGDAELLRVAEKCRIATKEFRDVIIGLDLPSGKGDVAKAFKVWAKTAWNRMKIAKLERRVGELEKLLDSVILKELLTKTNATALQQRSDFAQLDSQLQKLVGLILDGQMDIKALASELSSAITTRIDGVALDVKSTVVTDGQATRNLVTKLDSSAAARIDISARAVTSAVSHEGVATRDLLDATFRQADQRQHEMRNLDQELKSFDKLLHSVQSETANNRQTEVADAHETTYEWVFDPGNLTGSHAFSFSFEPTKSHSWGGEKPGSDEGEDTSETHLCNKSTDSKMDCFLCWLSSPKGKPYWVCGKPGSGKSTLMKYIVKSPRTRSTLKDVYGQDALILSHFIYLHGKKDQRSRKGILLSLTHQYLRHSSGNAAEIQSIQDVSSALQRQIPEIFLKGASSEWSYGELEIFLLALLEKSQRIVVIFIDGLDEVEDERQNGSPSPVLGLIDKLCRLARVHVCVSSRPEKVFVDRFEKDVHLTLQELTRHDISKYVTDHLRPFYKKDRSRRLFLEDLVKKVWDRSDGVFLWACIVTKNLAEALSNGDDDQMVRERLHELPRDINDLYQAMHKRLKDGHQRYQQYAAAYLQAVLHDYTSLSRRESCVITDLFSEDEVKGMLEQLISNPKRRYTWARSECEKLAKVVPLRTFYLVEVDDCKVRLLHRSAADFLGTPEGQEILKHHKPSDEPEIVLYLWRTLLFAALQNGTPFLFALGGFIRHLEENVLDSQPQLAMSLFLVCRRLYYSRMRRDSPATLVFPDVLKIGYCFNSFLARFDVPKLLFYAMTIGMGSFEMTPGSLQDDRLSQRRLPLVYSPDYLLFLVYQSLVVVAPFHSCGSLRHAFYFVNSQSDTYSWLLRNICILARPQPTLKPYVSLASIFLTSLQWEISTTMADVEVLQAALDMEGAWDEMPICTLWTHDRNVYFNVYGFFPTATQPGETGYVMQATMGFLVHLFLAQLYRTSPGDAVLSDPLVNSLRDEINRRYPSGIPPARVFAGFQTSEPEDEDEDHWTKTFFTLSPDHLLQISMPHDPRETSLMVSGKCLRLQDLQRGSSYFREIRPHVNNITLPLHIGGPVDNYESICISTQDIDEEEPEETSGDFEDGDKEWFSIFMPDRVTRLANFLTTNGRADFFEMSSLDKQVVSEEAFVQEVSKWRETTFDDAE